MLKITTGKTNFIARCAIIAGLYNILSLISFPISNGWVQVRLGEGLTLIAVLFPEAVPGLFFGCFLFNFISGCPILDVVLGSLITLISALLSFICTKRIDKLWLKIFIGGLFPVLLNAFLLPFVWMLCYYQLEYVYLVHSGLLLVGQSLSVYLVGTPMIYAINKMR